MGNRLTFDFAPKLIVIVGVYGYPSRTDFKSFAIFSLHGGFGLGSDYLYDDGGTSSLRAIFSSISANEVSWYSDSNSPRYQQNDTGATYFYVSIG